MIWVAQDKFYPCDLFVPMLWICHSVCISECKKFVLKRQCMAPKIVWKFSNKATKLCLNQSVPSLSSMNFNASYVIYFSLVLAVNQKRTFNFEKGCIIDIQLMIFLKQNVSSATHYLVFAWILSYNRIICLGCLITDELVFLYISCT